MTCSNLLDADVGLAIEAIEGIDREIAALCLAIDRGSPDNVAGRIDKLNAKRAMREHLSARWAAADQVVQQRAAQAPKIQIHDFQREQ
jgi:hypothetical protein